MMYFFLSFCIEKWRKKKFMKNSANQHYCQTEVTDGTEPLLLTVSSTLTLMGLLLSSRREGEPYTNNKWHYKYHSLIFTLNWS